MTSQNIINSLSCSGYVAPASPIDVRKGGGEKYHDAAIEVFWCGSTNSQE